MKEVAVTEVKEELAKYLKLAQKEAIVITRRGKPVGVLTAFKSEDDLFDYLLANDPRFLRRIKQAERSVEAGKGVRLEDLDDLAAFEERVNEPDLAFEDVLKDLRKRGKL